MAAPSVLPASAQLQKLRELERELERTLTHVAITETVERFRRARKLHWPEGVDEASLLAALGGDRWFVGETSGLRILQPGKAAGVLYGGCITLLVASLGTPYAPSTEGKLLFLEDRDVKPYQLDRLLRQMVLAGKFEGVTGIIFGEMLDCVAPGQKPGLLDEVILRVLDWFPGPIAMGLRSGHVSRRSVTLAFGIEAELHLERAPVLSFLERATEK